MSDLTKEIADAFGLTERIQQLKEKLLNVPFVEDVEFDLNGYLDNMAEVIFLTKYNIPLHDGYSDRRRDCRLGALKVAYESGLKPSGDRVENHDGWFYYVFDSSSWKPKFDFSGKA